VRSGLIGYMTEFVKTFPAFDYVAGVATAGIPHGTLLADRLQLPFAYVRSKPKDHGRQNLIEGMIAPGAKVIVVEDLISTGMSSLQAVEAIRSIPAEVVGVVALFQYGLPKATEAFQQAGCPFMTLTDFHTLVSVALDQKQLEPRHLEVLESWATDPVAWSENYLLNQESNSENK